MISRRTLINALGGSMLPLPSFAAGSSDPLPKICLEIGGGSLAAGLLDDAGIRRIKQLGVDYVVMGGPRMPWDEGEVRTRIERLKGGGLTLGNMMIGGFPKTLFGKPGRDEEIEKVRQSIRAAGRAGLPVIEYNFYAHRWWKDITRKPAAPARG